MLTDDIFLLALAVAFLAAHLIIWEWHMATDFTPLNSQVDQTLQTMAKAVSQLKVHVDTLSTNDDTATVAAVVARLKAGTDQLEAAIAAAQVAVAAAS